jgi:hypothetical protein
MNQLSTSLFDKGDVPQPTLTVGGWNLPSYGSNPNHDFSRAGTQMSGYSTYYMPSMYPLSTMTIPMNTFSMESPHMSSGISYRGNQFYGMSYPLHGTHSHRGNIYPHLTNPYHAFVYSHTSASLMIPVQKYMDQLGRGYFLLE